MLKPFEQVIATSIVALQKLVSFLGPDWSWVVAIVLLTAAVRLLLFPLFVKQIKSTRAMQALQPQMKALQAKHKGDKETLNREMMKLYKEHGTNPLASCLPILLQLPIFFALFRVLQSFAPRLTEANTYVFRPRFGISEETIEAAARAKAFGAPIATAFTSPAKLIDFLAGSPGAVKAVAVVLMVAMAVTTYITQKQVMAKAGPVEGQAAMQQKMLLYAMPILLSVFAIQVPLGVLVYWTTTNLWSMGQQALVIGRMAPPGPPNPGGKPPATTASPPSSAARPAKEAPPAKPAAATRPVLNGRSGGGNRAKKRSKGQRRGGRR